MSLADEVKTTTSEAASSRNNLHPASSTVTSENGAADDEDEVTEASSMMYNGANGGTVVATTTNGTAATNGNGLYSLANNTVNAARASRSSIVASISRYVWINHMASEYSRQDSKEGWEKKIMQWKKERTGL